MIHATCHCGAVRLEISRRPDALTECNCSICRRLAARWAYYVPAEIGIVMRPDATGIYSWGDKCIDFHHCRTCGVTTHYDGRGERPRRAVNARLIDPADIDGVPIRLFDGASSWTYIDD